MAFKIKNVSYKNILKDINYSFEDGKIYAILSNDDTEKAILGKILGGNITDYDGKISSMISSNKIKYLHNRPQDIFIYNSVKEELEESLKIKNYKEIIKEEKIDLIFKMVNLDKHIKNVNPNEISLGEQKLLSIGIFLVGNPKILILNEPVLDLDDYNKNIIIKLLKKISKKYNKIIIVLTNDLLLANELCDEFVLLNKGIISITGRKSKLLDINDKVSKILNKESKITEFIKLAKKNKNISLEMTYDINELMKDIYRNAK